MSVDLGKVSRLTGFVDKLIQIREIETKLDETLINDLLFQTTQITGVAFSNEEIEAAKRDITWKYQIFTSPGYSILADYEQENWYDDRKSSIVPKFWTRYRDYLVDEKNFSPNVVSTLSEDTLDQKLMNYILDPQKEFSQPVIKRGLIIGDVQSGKTSTYIGFICKAADAGYKVFILLTGTIEALRKQTQERVEEGFIGIDMTANSTGGKRVGVGLDNKPINAMALTSRASDFTGRADKIAVSLGSDKDAVVFVIKKNTTSLTKLTEWLVTLNADPRTKKINLPMIMIDDEADNASINTSASKEDPTRINGLIRKLANVFTRSNYIGFTATPFANVFIDPETTENMENQDLFPEDFIIALPTPSNYIGPSKIFAEDGKHHHQLVYINDAGREEEDGFPFYFKHKKTWDDSFPESIADAMYTFYLANAIRDLRGDFTEHRSMLINISRFIQIQYQLKSHVERVHLKAYQSVKFNLSNDFALSMKDPVIKRIYENWVLYYKELEFSWERIASVLFKAIENIQIKVVNSGRNSEKLDYPKTDSLRVIAIGGLALSRGLTLEGLVTSYFFRNTSTYDVLMQMGRWFGYRKDYEDLFRIWTHKSSAEWYAEIAEATDKLKDDIGLMRELGQKPKDFGIRVRNNSEELSITATNKMRNTADEVEYSSYFGDIIETPHLNYNPESHKSNFYAVEKLTKRCVEIGLDFKRGSSKRTLGNYLIQNVPKELIIDTLRLLKVSRFNTSFDPAQISDFLSNCLDSSIKLFDIVFMEGNNKLENSKIIRINDREITAVMRNKCVIDRDSDRLSLGRRGKLGGPNDGLLGISDFNQKRAEDIVEEAKEEFRRFYEEENRVPFTEDKAFPSRTWFRFIKDRKPLLIIYLVLVDVEPEESNQKKQIDELKEALGDTPVVGFALGFPQNTDAVGLRGTRYKVNRRYNWFEKDLILAESEEE